MTVVRFAGPGAFKFEREVGGHRYQRVPPNERHGRAQSSTITVAVLREVEETAFKLDERDLDIKTTRGSGPGGQARNKTETCVVITHKPTGLTVRSDAERSQHDNRRFARAILASRLAERQRHAQASAERTLRRDMVGTGERGDKRRTVAVQRDEVVDHQTGRRVTWKAYSRGHIAGLWR
jgi:peptide chain release factor 1